MITCRRNRVPNIRASKRTLQLFLCVATMLATTTSGHASECESLLGSIVVDETPRAAEPTDASSFLSTPFHLSRGATIAITLVRPGNAASFKVMLGDTPTSLQMQEIKSQVNKARKISATVVTGPTQGPTQVLGGIAMSKAAIVVLIAHNELGSIPFPNGESLSIAQVALAASKAGKLLVVESCNSACYFDTPGAAKEDVFVDESLNVAKTFRDMISTLEGRPSKYADVLRLYGEARLKANRTFIRYMTEQIIALAATATRYLPSIVQNLGLALRSTEVTRVVVAVLRSLKDSSGVAQPITLCQFQTLDGANHYFVLSSSSACAETFT